MTDLYWQFDTVCVQINFLAVELARRIYSGFRYHKILFVGAGESSELVAKHFQDSVAVHFTVANRGAERRKALAGKVGGMPITLLSKPVVWIILFRESVQVDDNRNWESSENLFPGYTDLFC